MELTTFQHILEQRGLEGIAQRACQHHADKWTSFFRTGDHETEFQQLIDLAIKVQTMRKMFADGDVMMEAILEAENLQTCSFAIGDNWRGPHPPERSSKIGIWTLP